MNGVGQLRMLQVLDYSMHLEAPFVKWSTRHTRHCGRIFCNNPMDFFFQVPQRLGFPWHFVKFHNWSSRVYYRIGQEQWFSSYPKWAQNVRKCICINPIFCEQQKGRILDYCQSILDGYRDQSSFPIHNILRNTTFNTFHS
jgi:hypothetical protein